MRRGARRLALPAAFAVAAAACSNPERLTRREFTERANAICAEANARIGTVPPPDPADPELVANTIEQIVAVQRDAVEDLDGLRPSEAIEPHVDDWLELLIRVLDEEERVATAVAEGDMATVDAASAAAAAANAEAESLASDLGFAACTTAGGAAADAGVPRGGGSPEKA